MSGNVVAAFLHQHGRQIECGEACAQTREIRPTEAELADRVALEDVHAKRDNQCLRRVVGRVPG